MSQQLKRTHHARWLRIAFIVTLLLSGRALACTVSATGLAFGSIDPLSATDTTGTATVSVTCPAPASYSLSLSAGAGSYVQRTLTSGVLVLNYNLYTDVSATQVWGDGSGSTFVVSGSADSNGAAHTVYGLVPYQSQAVPGTYADTIVVTLSY